MDTTPQLLQTIATAAQSLTVVGLLALAVWGYATGRIPTKAEVQRLEAELERERAEKQALRDELKANLLVTDRLSVALDSLKESIAAVRTLPQRR